MNKVIINGHLTTDMEVTVTKQSDIGNFTIANNRGYGDNQRTSFVRCSLFGKRVESLVPYLLKGCKVLITGELDIVSKEVDGEYKTYTNIIVDELEIEKFVEEKEEEQPKKKDYKKGNKR